MRIKQGTLLTIVFALGIGVGAFFVSKGVETLPPPAAAKPLVSWLHLAPAQVRNIQDSKENFDREMAALHDRYDRARNQLSVLFGVTSTSDQALLAQMTRVMTAHDALQRHTVRYALALRSQLTPDQKEKFMGLLADYSRGSPNDGREQNWGQGRGRGWGGPPNHRSGRGGGRGQHRYRWGQVRAIYGRIPLSPEKIQALQKVDPNFTNEITQLVTGLQRENQALTSLFEQDSAGDASILSQLEKTITAHDALETRVGQHILVVRSHLSPDQQRQLMDLCAENVQKTCCRSKETGWRSGGEGQGRESPDRGTSQHK